MNNMALKIYYDIYHTDAENAKSNDHRGWGKELNRIQYHLIKRILTN